MLFSLLISSHVKAQYRISCDLESLSEITLLTSPDLLRSNLQIKDAETEVQRANSIFDLHLSSGINANRSNTNLHDADPRKQHLTSSLIAKSADFFIATQKKFRSGTIADISTKYVGTSSNYPLNNYNEMVGPYLTNRESSATLTITQPILKGAGKKANQALTIAAESLLKSSVDNYNFNATYEIVEMTNAYWTYLGAFKMLDIYIQNEKRIGQVLEMTTELVKADKKPESDLLQIRADLASQEKQTNIAKQNLYEAKLNLGRTIGIDEESSKALGSPIDDFPHDITSYKTSLPSYEQLSRLALTNRLDIKVLKKQQDATDHQMIFYKKELLPALDLSAFTTYGGAAFGGGVDQYFNAFSNKPGRNNIVGLSLIFSFPVRNNLAKSNYTKAVIAKSDQELAFNDLKRNIEINVSLAYTNLSNSISILEKTEESLAYSIKVFDNEQDKFQNGLTTLLNLILLQERLTLAQLDNIQAKQRLASAIVALRFETGTLFDSPVEHINKVDRQQFYTIPNHY